MPDFDGENLIITLDPVVNGVLTVAAFEDLYEPWKDWLLGDNGNMRYPRLFRPLGGDPLTSIINAGSYLFFNNVAGWRLKPYENDGAYWVVGNIAPENVDTPILKPTDGAFTAAIFGLQPVTQGVTAAMGEQLENISYNNMVCVSSSGYAGTGLNSAGELIGTRQAPSNNMTDSLAIALARGFNHFNLNSSFTLTTEDLSAGYRFTADSPFSTLTIEPAADVTNCSVLGMTLTGEMDGLNLVESTRILDITALSGMLHKIALAGNVTLSGDLLMMESYSNWTGEGHTDVTVGTHTLEVRDFHGSFGVAAMTGGTHSIGITEGRLIVDADCTGGTIYLRGTPYEVQDNSNGAVTIIDQTQSLKIRDLHGQLTRSVFIDTEAAVNGNGYQQTPFNNFTDAVDYAELNGLKHLTLLADADMDRNLKNFVIIGIGTPKIDCGGYSLDKCEISHCTLTGAYTGKLVAQDCNLTGSFSLNGFFENCAMGSTFTIPDGGVAYVKDCSAFVVGQVIPSFDVGTATGTGSLIVTGYNGGMSILNVNQATDDVKLAMNVSKAVLDASCTDGTINVGGVTRVLDNSGVGCTVTNEALDPIHMQDVWKAAALDPDNPRIMEEGASFTAGTDITVGAVTTGTAPNRVTTQTRAV